MEGWDKELQECFSQSLFFASHPHDEDRAFQWLNYLRERDVGMKEVRRQVTALLRENTTDQRHIDQKIKGVEDH